MCDIGVDMYDKYKEILCGGLVVNVIECWIGIVYEMIEMLFFGVYDVWLGGCYLLYCGVMVCCLLLFLLLWLLFWFFVGGCFGVIEMFRCVVCC